MGMFGGIYRFAPFAATDKKGVVSREGETVPTWPQAAAPGNHTKPRGYCFQKSVERISFSCNSNIKITAYRELSGKHKNL